MEPNHDNPALSIKTKRKRGGQPGNLNAIRHGFYSKSFTESEMLALDSNVNGEFTDEIAAARVNAARLAELMKDYKNMAIQDYIAASNTFNNYMDTVRSLSRDQKFLYHNQTTIEKALEELSSIPADED